MNTVTALFADHGNAEKAVNELRDNGFDKEISIIAKGSEENEEYKGIDKNSVMFGGDSLANGTVTGAVLGGAAGLLAGLGAIAIPGIGALFAAGPIAGMFGGAAAGSVAGGLVDLGIPHEKSEHLEEEVKRGKFLAIVQAGDEHRANQAAEVLRDFGADHVEIH